ncbi:MAG: type IX secretion system membrane protein PorP/SprF [Cyclobacteriaceae bacterium]|jgi:type IX secretion system PorP/SprF family membrane protein|nr:type IX secretion system membrane protein PorP/SprF [Flammeovirgaceae bacterium]
MFWNHEKRRRHLRQGSVLLIAALGWLPAHAQQDPVYAQYINNPMAINPAFAGSNNRFNANVQYRTQWAGIEANPITLNFNSHMSVFQNKVGVGIQVVQDKIGENTTTEFAGVYSYKIDLNNASFSFGLQTGFVRYTNDPSRVNPYDSGDPLFANLTETKFNTGAGLLLKSGRYTVGLSVPRLLPTTISQGGQDIELYQQHVYLFGQYTFFINEDWRFKPSTLLRTTSGAPASVDLNATFNFQELYSAGLFTRNFKTYGLLVQAVFKSMRLGYILELPSGSDSGLNFTSHEITLGFSMPVLSFHDRSMIRF